MTPTHLPLEDVFSLVDHVKKSPFFIGAFTDEEMTVLESDYQFSVTPWLDSRPLAEYQTLLSAALRSLAARGLIEHESSPIGAAINPFKINPILQACMESRSAKIDQLRIQRTSEGRIFRGVLTRTVMSTELFLVEDITPNGLHTLSFMNDGDSINSLARMVNPDDLTLTANDPRIHTIKSFRILDLTDPRIDKVLGSRHVSFLNIGRTDQVSTEQGPGLAFFTTEHELLVGECGSKSPLELSVESVDQFTLHRIIAKRVQDWMFSTNDR